MEDNETKTVLTTRGISFTGMLQVAFIVLKLCGVIDWSWWWVLAPIWISACLAAFLLLLALGLFLLAEWLKRR